MDRTTSRLSKKDSIRGEKAETIRPLISSYDPAMTYTATKRKRKWCNL